MQLKIDDCPVLKKDNFIVDVDGNRKGPDDKQLLDLNQNAQQLIKDFNTLDALLDEIKKGYPNKYEKASNSVWKICRDELDSICKVLKKPCIQIGFLGGFSIGKSYLLNEMFAGGLEHGLAKTGTSNTPTSSAVVSFFKSSNKEDFELEFLTEDQLNEKKDFTLKSLIQEKGLAKSDNSLVELSQIFSNVTTKSQDLCSWLFLDKANQKSSELPLGKKIKVDKIEFFKAVNHRYSKNEENLYSGFVLTGRSPCLPKECPSIVEIVDTPGVAANVQDNWLLTQCYKNIDAFIYSHEASKLANSECKKYYLEIRKSFTYDGQKTNRICSIITKMYTLVETSIDVHEHLQSFSEGFVKFFILNAKPDDKAPLFVDSQDFTDLFKKNYERTFQKFNPQTENFKKHIEGFKCFSNEMRELFNDGGISSFKNFLLYEWPIKIVLEIIAKGRFDIKKSTEKAYQLKKELELAKNLTLNEREQIRDACNQLAGVKDKLCDPGYKPLKTGLDGMKKAINDKFKVIPIANTTRDQVIASFRTNAKIVAEEVLISLICDLIPQCYQDISSQISLEVRCEKNDDKPKSLCSLWMNSIPFQDKNISYKRADLINQPSSKILNYINGDFCKYLKDKTGLDEYLAGLKKDTDDLFSFANANLQANNNSVSKYSAFLRKAFEVLATDCAEVLKLHLFSEIDILIEKFQVLDDWAN